MFVGAAEGTNSAVLPAHQPGDLIIGFAFRSGSTTVPSTPAGQGWTVRRSNGANSCALLVVFKYAASSNEQTGTFTNASRVNFLVYRNIELNTANDQVNAGSNASPSIWTIASPGANSWALRYVGHRTATTISTLNGHTVRSTTAGNPISEAQDSAGPPPSWSTQTFTANTSSGWRTYACELIPTAAPPQHAEGTGVIQATGDLDASGGKGAVEPVGQTPQVVSHSSYTGWGPSHEVPYPQGVQAGRLLLLFAAMQQNVATLSPADAGWTPIAVHDCPNWRGLYVWGRTATGSEGEETVLSVSTGYALVAASIVQVANQDPARAISSYLAEISYVGAETWTGDFVTPAIPEAVATRLVFRVPRRRLNQTMTNPAGVTQIADIVTPTDGAGLRITTDDTGSLDAKTFTGSAEWAHALTMVVPGVTPKHAEGTGTVGANGTPAAGPGRKTGRGSSTATAMRAGGTPAAGVGRKNAHRTPAALTTGGTPAAGTGRKTGRGAATATALRAGGTPASTGRKTGRGTPAALATGGTPAAGTARKATRGTAALQATGTPVSGVGHKTARRSVTLTSGGTPAAGIGRKAGRGTVALPGGGTPTAGTGRRTGRGVAALAAGGDTIGGVGRRTSRGTATTLTAGGTPAVTQSRKGGRGTASTLSAGHGLASTGRKVGRGAALVPGGGGITSSSGRRASGTALLVGGLALGSTGRKNARRAATLPGGGSAVGAGRKNTTGSGQTGGGGTTLSQGRKAGRGSSLLPGAGSVLAGNGARASGGTGSVPGTPYLIAGPGTKRGRGTATDRANGSPAAGGGHKAGRGATSVAGGGFPTANGASMVIGVGVLPGAGATLAGPGRKRALSSPVVATRATVAAGAGRSARSGYANIDGGGHLFSSGEGAENPRAEGLAVLPGGGALVSSGRKRARGTSGLGAGLGLAATGYSLVAGSVLVAGGGHVAAQGRKAASGTGALSTAGEVTSDGHMSGAAGVANLSTGGALSVVGRKRAAGSSGVATGTALDVGSGRKAATGAGPTLSTAGDVLAGLGRRRAYGYADLVTGAVLAGEGDEGRPWQPFGWGEVFDVDHPYAKVLEHDDPEVTTDQGDHPTSTLTPVSGGVE